MTNNYLEIKDLWVRYSKKQDYALKGISLSIGKSEIVSILGPSGSGKSTLLKAIAGIVPVERGSIAIDGIDITYLPPNKRNVGVVFQSFALFPHMNVRENIAYGLKVRKFSHNEIEARVKELVTLLGLSGLENRYPNQLSGGQQQRVALARALAIEPALILLDEPMSNIDPIFRGKLREELRNLLKDRGVTAVYVTHDRDDAFEVADKVAIIRDGKLEQYGATTEIFRRPKNRFVAEFIGIDNIIEFNCDGICRESSEYILATSENYHVVFPIEAKKSTSVLVGIYKENLELRREKPVNAPWISGTVTDVVFVGTGHKIFVKTALGRLQLIVKDSDEYFKGEIVFVTYNPDNVVILGE